MTSSPVRSSPGLGLRAFADGLKHGRHPSLTHYTWVPALISLLVIGSGLYLALDYLTGVSRSLIEALPGWLSWLEAVLTPLLYLLGVLLGAWLFAMLAVLIASPFLGAYSMALERNCFGDAPSPSTSLWTDVSSSIGRELRKLAYYLPRLVVVFLVTLIPVINLAAPAIWLVFGAWMMAIQFADYPTENRGQPFQTTLAKLRANRAAALAFGACATAALMIPLVNFLLIPIAVAGGTLLWRALDGEFPTDPGTA